MFYKVFVLTLIVKVVTSQYPDFDTKRPAFDPSFYKDALDPELCRAQLSHIRRLSNGVLRMRFLESGLKFPRSILEGNNIDLGNYRQCLEINQDIGDSVIEGKYCMTRFQTNENFINFAASLNPEFDANVFKNNETLKQLKNYDEKMSTVPLSVSGVPRFHQKFFGADVSFRIAVCIPKTCTIQEGIRGLLFNISTLGIRYEEEFCRLNDDKPWVPADYIAISVFSVIGLLTLLSTSYDVWHTLVAKKDPKTANTICCSFSVYTNTRRLTTFTENPNALKCVDGIRSLAMLWVIVGHTYQTLPTPINNLQVFNWLLVEWYSVWITAAPYSVDTFFFLTGLLTVYTTIGKMTSMKLIKNLHFYYLTRLLRMFPLLATTVLLQASVFNRIADGPLWDVVANNTNRCRTYWWSTLLYVQNYVNPGNDCINHAWYLAIDMQLYIISPLILFWVLKGDKKISWIALTVGLLVSLTASAIYCFINQLPGWVIARPRGTATALEDLTNYMYFYYFNTLTRAPPFFVGMIFGYILHLWRGKNLKMHPALAVCLWVFSIALTLSLMYVTHLMKDFENWDTRVVDDLVNSFARSLWAMAIGWIIFASHKGYGGPINWFLSLNVWNLPSRISLAMFLLSYPMQYVISGTALSLIVFTDAFALYEFAAQVVVIFVVSFVLTVVIDSPFSTLVKLVLDGGTKKPKKENEDKK